MNRVTQPTGVCAIVCGIAGRRCLRRAARAFTLLELLVAIGVVLTVAAIVFPVVAQARRSGYLAASITHMRQVGLAIQMYLDDNDGSHPFRHIDPMIEAGYVKNPGLLKSHPDTFERGYGYEVSQCFDQTVKMTQETSYESAFFGEAFWFELNRHDENAAILADRTHGAVTSFAGKDCNDTEIYFTGRLLRLYRDTSIKVARFNIDPRPDAPPSTGYVFARARLFTDVRTSLE